VEEKVPKLKTKSSAKKRFNFTATGKVIAQPAFKRHNLRKRPQKMKRQARGTMILSVSDTKNILKYMPYK
jgi:large subunit ribosomal protein L35